MKENEKDTNKWKELTLLNFPYYPKNSIHDTIHGTYIHLRPTLRFMDVIFLYAKPTRAKLWQPFYFISNWQSVYSYHLLEKVKSIFK